MTDNNEITVKIWERWENETVKAFSAFTQYLYMKPTERSYGNLLGLLDKSEGYVGQIHRWAHDYQWQKRLQAWTDYQAAKSAGEYDEARLEVRRARQNLVRVLLSFASRASNQIGTGAVDVGELDRLSRATARILDQARQEFNDLPTQRSEVDNTVRVAWAEPDFENDIGIGSDELQLPDPDDSPDVIAGHTA